MANYNPVEARQAFEARFQTASDRAAYYRELAAKARNAHAYYAARRKAHNFLERAWDRAADAWEAADKHDDQPGAELWLARMRECEKYGAGREEDPDEGGA